MQLPKRFAFYIDLVKLTFTSFNIFTAKHRRKTATINVNHELHAQWSSMKKAHGFRNDSDSMKYLLDTFE